MPNNWLYLGAALAMLPGARVVDCRREPLETAWSCFKQLFPAGAVFAYAYEDIAAWLGGYERAMAAWTARAPAPCSPQQRRSSRAVSGISCYECQRSPSVAMRVRTSSCRTSMRVPSAR